MSVALSGCNHELSRCLSTSCRAACPLAWLVTGTDDIETPWHANKCGPRRQGLPPLMYQKVLDLRSGTAAPRGQTVFPHGARSKLTGNLCSHLWLEGLAWTAILLTRPQTSHKCQHLGWPPKLPDREHRQRNDTRADRVQGRLGGRYVGTIYRNASAAGKSLK